MSRVLFNSSLNHGEFQILNREVSYVREYGPVVSALGTEKPRCNPGILEDVAPKLDLLDEWQQTKFCQRRERLETLACWLRVPMAENQSVVEVWGGCIVPGKACRGTRLET